ncbi:MAG: hypothetical protein JW993_16460 [Sedimentisphaerales bacterium]|nr:hypothetical protein [Sedimentisphaerales bacterium]
MNCKNPCLKLLFCTVVTVGAISPAYADITLQNGDFSSGLAGWTVEWGDVTDGGGYALFQEDAFDISSTLSQQFTLPLGAQLLSFDLTLSAEGDRDPFAWPDAFTASLLDAATFDPLITWDPFVTEFFLLENTGAMETSAGMAVAGNTISLDVSSWRGQDVLLSFDLWGSYDGMTTTTHLDNVDVSVVPLPSAVLLAIVGLGSSIIGLPLKRKRVV